ncbi:methylated-DNA--[protein]-cysteine S-methyltransferase [Dermatophilus congolensis]|uniref:methylated-DNA--[protein]-cysteine S-methyltransferase n=1 Tax=Dermatophilus congolensis TaxID=1863 RepID=UPI0015EFDE2F|nr:methylated-DNA--[protein]-cysteine S-methyltransferase [Dermatophilus congolensis]
MTDTPRLPGLACHFARPYQPPRPHQHTDTMTTHHFTYITINTPIGELLIAQAQERVIYIAFGSENHTTALTRITNTTGPGTHHETPILHTARTQLTEYFTGTRHHFTLPLDHRMSTPFRRTIQTHLTTIPYGSTLTYTQLATQAGHPTAIRAAATACATNPLPLLLPCHRIIRANGNPGQYRGGTEAKKWLLTHEKTTPTTPNSPTRTWTFHP